MGTFGDSEEAGAPALRARRASALVAGLLMVAGMVCCLLPPDAPAVRTEEAVVDGATMTRRVWEAMREGEGIEDAVASETALSVVPAGDLPNDLLEEVMGAVGADRVLATPDLGLLGFGLPYGSEDAMRKLLEGLGSRGWVAAGTESEGVVTLVKGEGEFRWLMAQVVGMGEGSSVVLRIARG